MPFIFGLIALIILNPAYSQTQVPPTAAQLTEQAERRADESQPPDLVMDLIGIKPGLVIGEVGAGRGRVTVHLAARVGEKGKIYANDINEKALEYLKERCRKNGQGNVETILGAVDDARLPKNALDLVFMAWVFHHVDKPVALLKSLLPSLKPWGAVVMVEPTPEKTESTARALTEDWVREEAEAAGFTLDTTIKGRLQGDTIFVLRPAVPDAPDSRDPAKVRSLWLEYLAWLKNAKPGSSPRDYAADLDRNGLSAPEIRRRLKVIRNQFTEQPEGIEMIYDPLYAKPLTGVLEQDGFKTDPNEFLVAAMKTIPAGGKALDVGAGMGRNALHLAKLGWDVTGIDLSAQGLAVLQAGAKKSGLSIRTVKTSYADYDFGRQSWDLVAMILSWAPVEEPAFLARIKDSIRPGGYIVFEHVLQRNADPFAPGVHAVAPGALRDMFRDFEILIYRELDDYGDWGGPPTGHVRMVARKRES